MVFGYIDSLFLCYVNELMITHYFTLQALLKEFQPRLTGVGVEEIFSQQKNELVVSFPSSSLIVSIDPLLNFVVLRERVTRARKNSVDLFHGITGSETALLTLHPADRTIECRMKSGLILYIQLYNSASSNIILTDTNNSILEAFKGDKEKRGERFVIVEKDFDSGIDKNENLFTDAIRSDMTRTISAALKQTIPLLGTQFVNELLFRAGIDATESVQTISTNQTSFLYRELEALRESVQHPKPVIYTRENGIKVFSVIPLQSMERFEYTSYPDTNSAVAAFLTSSFREKGIEGEKKDIQHKLEKELKRVRRSLKAVTTQLEESGRAEEYERNGKLILANIAAVTKGMREMTIPDFESEQSLVTITLHPALSPALNAEHYFEKAKKSRVALKESAERQLALTRTVILLEQMINALDEDDTTEDIKEFKKEFEKDLLAMKLFSPPKGGELPPFRIFSVAGSYEVWVGKSSANNDLLTMKYAKPNDLWFHVRGASGSHTVLKVKSGAEPPKEAIRGAASIAAYYSKMRNAGSVPVAYCERKFVRKPKGMAQGAVILEREKTIFVKPGLP
jgi:predicted ribosome quality control (RQC) complex YloA/Tae2 family protein